MKVRQGESSTVEFIHLKRGEVFTYVGSTYMRTNGNRDIAAVNLEEGELTFFNDDDIVTRYPNANLTLE
jgi:hypothetical protein